MPFEWVSNSLGGGLIGLFGVVIVVMALAMYFDLKAQVKEQKADNKELRSTLSRLTDVVESWTPDEQRKRLKRP